MTWIICFIPYILCDSIVDYDATDTDTDTDTASCSLDERDLNRMTYYAVADVTRLCLFRDDILANHLRYYKLRFFYLFQVMLLYYISESVYDDSEFTTYRIGSIVNSYNQNNFMIIIFQHLDWCYTCCW